MATWDSKEREQFKIDSENIKNEIDKIQSEKIKEIKKSLIELEVKIVKNAITEIKSQEKLSKKIDDFNEKMTQKTAKNEVDLAHFYIETENTLKTLKQEIEHKSTWMKINSILILIAIIQGVMLWLKLKAN